jgi:hypothetical protein
MAAVHYLDYPRKAGICKPRLDVKKSKLYQVRRRVLAMDTLLQHAYVAQLDETLFCPNDTSTIDAPFLLSRIAGQPLVPSDNLSHLQPHPGLLESESGDIGITGALEGQEGTIWHTRPVIPLEPHTSASLILPNGSHTTQMEWYVPGEPRWSAPTFPSIPIQPGDRHILHDVPPRVTTHEVYGSWATIDSILHSGRPPLSSYTVDHSTEIPDDCRGSYDFSDFLERWHRRNEQAPASVNALQDDEVGNDTDRDTVEREGVDMQGLKWSMVDRATANNTRRSCHPSSPKYTPHWTKVLHQPASPDDEGYYRFRRFSPQHRAQTSHHQLRNTVASTSRSDVVYAAGDRVCRTSLLSPEISDTVIDLSSPTTCASGFRITCLATSPASQGDNIVLAGGFSGEYAMLDLNSEDGGLSEGFVSHAYNSVVTHISTGHDRRSGQLSAAFCSNDKFLRVMDVATARFVHTQAFEHAINCSAVATANRLRAVVGDSINGLVLDADSSEVVATLEGHSDHIFSTAWSPDGRILATGAEDGRICIWDARNWKQPLATRSCIMSTPRSLQFTDDNFLVAAEDEDVVCIYEPQDFSLRQSVQFFGAIAGVTLLDGGAEMVVANSDRSVGGLLSFQKADQGLHSGSYGRRLDCSQDQAEPRYRPRRRSGRSCAEQFDVLL